MPYAVSPRRWRIYGDRNMPTRMFTPRLNQLEVTFLRISILRIRASFLGPWVACYRPCPTGGLDRFACRCRPIPVTWAHEERNYHRTFSATPAVTTSYPRLAM